MRIQHTLIILIGMLVVTPVMAQDTAAITTYTATVGDELIFDYTRQPGEQLEVSATIASIDSETGNYTLNVIISAPQAETLTATWSPTQDFIEKNFLGLETRREVLQISDVTLETTKVSSGDLSFWFYVSADGTSQFPELVRATRGTRVLINLREIVREPR